MHQRLPVVNSLDPSRNACCSVDRRSQVAEAGRQNVVRTKGDRRRSVVEARVS